MNQIPECKNNIDVTKNNLIYFKRFKHNLYR